MEEMIKKQPVTLQKYLKALYELKELTEVESVFPLIKFITEHKLMAQASKGLTESGIIIATPTKNKKGNYPINSYRWNAGEITPELAEKWLDQCRIVRTRNEKFVAAEYERSQALLENGMNKRQEKEETSNQELEKLAQEAKEFTDQAIQETELKTNKPIVLERFWPYLRILYNTIQSEKGVIKSNNKIVRDMEKNARMNPNSMKILEEMGVLERAKDKSNLFLVGWSWPFAPDQDLAEQFYEAVKEYQKGVAKATKNKKKGSEQAVQAIKKNKAGKVKQQPESTVKQAETEPNFRRMPELLPEKREMNARVIFMDHDQPLMHVALPAKGKDTQTISELAKAFAELEDYEFALELMKKLK